MKTKKLNIAENNFEFNASRDMVLKVIDSQINNYKVKFMSDWEKDHSTCPSTKNEKIKMLEMKKAEIIGLYKTCKTDDPLVDLNISIDVTIKEEMSVAV